MTKNLNEQLIEASGRMTSAAAKTTISIREFARLYEEILKEYNDRIKIALFINRDAK